MKWDVRYTGLSKLEECVDIHMQLFNKNFTFHCFTRRKMGILVQFRGGCGSLVGLLCKKWDNNSFLLKFIFVRKWMMNIWKFSEIFSYIVNNYFKKYLQLLIASLGYTENWPISWLVYMVWRYCIIGCSERRLQFESGPTKTGPCVTSWVPRRLRTK